MLVYIGISNVTKLDVWIKGKTATCYLQLAKNVLNVNSEERSMYLSNSSLAICVECIFQMNDS